MQPNLNEGKGQNHVTSLQIYWFELNNLQDFGKFPGEKNNWKYLKIMEDKEVLHQLIWITYFSKSTLCLVNLLPLFE